MQKDSNNQQFKNAIALTGGIATGKSTVASLFMMHGFLTIDADSIAHKILDNNTSKISDLFGNEYIKNGKVNRPKLGELIFTNLAQKKILEQFIHPLIKEQIIKEAQIFEQQNKPYLIDIPLFFENKNYDINKSIVVYTTKKIQLQRLQKRDNSTIDEAQCRIDNQMNIDTKRNLASFVIDNTKDLKNLQKEVERIKKVLILAQP